MLSLEPHLLQLKEFLTTLSLTGLTELFDVGCFFKSDLCLHLEGNFSGLVSHGEGWL